MHTGCLSCGIRCMPPAAPALSLSCMPRAAPVRANGWVVGERLHAVSSTYVVGKCVALQAWLAQQPCMKHVGSCPTAAPGGRHHCLAVRPRVSPAHMGLSTSTWLQTLGPCETCLAFHERRLEEQSPCADMGPASMVHAYAHATCRRGCVHSAGRLCYTANQPGQCMDTSVQTARARRLRNGRCRPTPAKSHL